MYRLLGFCLKRPCKITKTRDRQSTYTDTLRLFNCLFVFATKTEGIL